MTASPLHALLQVFNAESLGEGDQMAGSNVLAAMCASLANLHPPGACLATPEGNRLAVGMSFATIGGLSDSLVAEKVLNPIAHIQNNFTDHLAADAAHTAAKLAALPAHERMRIRSAEPANVPELANLKVDIKGLMAARDSSAFLQLLAPCRHQGIDEFVSNPTVFLNAGLPADLENQLHQSHRRYPYIRAALADNQDTERVESILRSVIHGTSRPSELAGPVHIRGHLAASCTSAKLAQAVAAGEGSLLGELLWLTDGDGCPLSSAACAGNAPAPYQTYLNYSEALRRVWAARLDYRQSEVPIIRYDWEPRQREWVALLQKLEPRCPGITRAVRPLFGTLYYGLMLLWVDSKAPPRWTEAGVLELAKLLIGRMVQCRELLAQTERDGRLLELSIKILSKLEAGPLDARGIVRKSNRLRTADCREALGLIARLGVGREVGEGKWGLTLPLTQAVHKIRSPYIDV